MRFNNRYIILLLLIVLSGCTRRNLQPVQYVKWIENDKHGLLKIKKVKDYVYTAQYKPYDYIALKETSKLSDLSKSNIKRIKNEIEGFYYFTIQISSADEQTPMLKNNISDENEYYERINYFTTYAQNDLHLIDGNDTLNCTLYIFEQTYKITPHNRLVIGFKKNHSNKEYNNLELVFNDEILNTGIIKFFYDKKDLNSIPFLKIM